MERVAPGRGEANGSILTGSSSIGSSWFFLDWFKGGCLRRLPLPRAAQGVGVPRMRSPADCMSAQGPWSPQDLRADVE